MEQTFDSGAQNERTSLAWTRTALALLVGVVLATRLAAEPMGAVAVAFGAVVAPVAGVILVMARRRYKRAHVALHHEASLPDGRLPAMVAVVTALLAVLEVAYALTSS